MSRTRLLSLLAALAALLLVLGACADDDADQAAEQAEEDDAPLALDDDGDDDGDDEAVADDADDATEEDEAAEEAEEAGDVDLAASVNQYASTLPDGWMMIREAEELNDAMQVDGAVVIDVRNPEDYEEGHIPGAVNIPIRELPDNLNSIPTDSPVWIVCQTGWRTGMAVSSLRMMGYDNVEGWANEFPAWEEAGYEIETGEGAALEDFGEPDLEPELVEAVGQFLSTLPDGWLLVREVDEVMDAVDAGAVLLDVRNIENFEEGTVEGALEVPIRELGSPDLDIPADSNVIVYCQSGWRTSLAVPILHVLGYDNVLGYPGHFDTFESLGAVTS